MYQINNVFSWIGFFVWIRLLAPVFSVYKTNLWENERVESINCKNNFEQVIVIRNIWQPSTDSFVFYSLNMFTFTVLYQCKKYSQFINLFCHNKSSIYTIILKYCTKGMFYKFSVIYILCWHSSRKWNLSNETLRHFLDSAFVRTVNIMLTWECNWDCWLGKAKKWNLMFHKV